MACGHFLLPFTSSPAIIPLIAFDKGCYGSFEIFPDEGIIEVRQGVVTIPLIYTWDGSILTTVLDFGLYFETDYWRKL